MPFLMYRFRASSSNKMSLLPSMGVSSDSDGSRGTPDDEEPDVLEELELDEEEWLFRFPPQAVKPKATKTKSNKMCSK